MHTAADLACHAPRRRLVEPIQLVSRCMTVSSCPTVSSCLAASCCPAASRCPAVSTRVATCCRRIIFDTGACSYRGVPEANIFTSELVKHATQPISARCEAKHELDMGSAICGLRRLKVKLHYAYKVRNIGRVRPRLRFCVLCCAVLVLCCAVLASASFCVLC